MRFYWKCTLKTVEGRFPISGDTHFRWTKYSASEPKQQEEPLRTKAHQLRQVAENEMSKLACEL